MDNGPLTGFDGRVEKLKHSTQRTAEVTRLLGETYVTGLCGSWQGWRQERLSYVL